ncbi:MAG: DUF3048 domain-containing protein [Acidobacteriota bacterium]|nr:DUF3048 domain-containing protein [Acidobacteriota bacterium]MDE3030101.1 DUF3048 domain-containing protein [Acidobacteriota bacterium]MDE3139733.1 DUF3048 domain-containing protein [Acidobacteriota bacterium]MDE3146376.1 DUF3048 domain-containing protein [Acidobacteriota bacterium]
MRNQLRYIVAAVVIVIGIVVIVLTQGSSKNSPSSATGTSTTTTSPHGPIAPLTGLPDPSGTALKRPAVVVKIEDDTNSLPQWGVDQADVVYEEIINGGIPRLAAVFNQNAPARVGPIRSVRPTDTQIVGPIGGIFAFSGGAPYAIASISTAPVKLVDESAAGAAMFRDPSRQAPYNLFGSVASIYALGGGTPVPPQPLFQYRPLGQPAVGVTVSKFVVNFPSIYPMTWTWNATTHSWDRSTQFAGADYTANHVRESPKNVIVNYVNYVNGVGAFTSYANLQSGGVADVFTDGKEIVGTWARHSKNTPIVYLDSKGKAIRLTPGQTWVELLNNGAPVTVTH